MQEKRQKLYSTCPPPPVEVSLSEADVNAAMREVRVALLEADVNYKIAKDFCATVKERAIGEEVMKSLTPGQQVVKIVNEELTALMGGDSTKSNANKLITSSKPPTVILMAGLQGSGKTTSAGKIALYLKNQGKRPLLAAGDVYRPAAIQQLEVLGQRIGVPVFSLGDKAKPVKIATDAVAHARAHGNDYLIIDTAGRLAIDEEMMQEISDIRAAVEPTEILLVIDAMQGQDAVNVAAAFHERLHITGIVLTKLDGDSRGGAALSVKAVTGQPIKFVGSGEDIKALEEQGCTVTTLSREEQEKWAASLPDVVNGLVKSLDDAGYNGSEIVEDYYEILESQGVERVRDWKISE